MLQISQFLVCELLISRVYGNKAFLNDSASTELQEESVKHGERRPIVDC